jgi:hypothetical protein
VGGCTWATIAGFHVDLPVNCARSVALVATPREDTGC